MKLFGYTLSRETNTDQLKSISSDPADGSAVVETSGMGEGVGDAYGYSMSFDIDPSIISEQQLIAKYREIALVPEVEMAIDDIINEMAATDENDVVTIDLDQLKYSKELKNQILEEFGHVINLLDFNNNSFETFKRWYVDGRLTYQVVVDPATYQQVGIGKLTYLDPRLVKKVKVVKREKDVRTGIDLFTDREEYYLFSETGFGSSQVTSSFSDQGIKLSKDMVVQITSGLLNPSNSVVLSYLHKAIRPLNQLRSLEDAAIIYRLSRAPERRIFYIDVGNLPPAKADQVLKRQMNQYRSKMVYDIASGTVRSDVKQMAMTEDYWLPRRSDGKATEITTLPGGQNLGEMTEVDYFLNKLYKSLNVPVSRLDSQAGFNFGRVTEINRDEIKFMKFVGRLRRRFSNLFLELLQRQLALKNIINPDEFNKIRNLITFEFKSDNVFEESKNIEIMTARMTLLEKVHQYRGVYYSDEFIKRDVLQQSMEEIDEMAVQISGEESSGVYEKGTSTEEMSRQQTAANIEATQTAAQAQLKAAEQPQIVVQQPSNNQVPAIPAPRSR